MKTRKDKRDALIGELESIRALLNEDEQHANIPLLIPENHQQVSDRIPVLSVIATENQTPQPDDPLQATRQAAAKITSKAARPPEPLLPAKSEPTPSVPAIIAPERALMPLPAAVNSSVSQREKLVDDIVRSALPRMEALLRELVQEALLQEKLRGGKR